MKWLPILLFFVLTITAANAQEILVSDGGLLGIEGQYTANLTEAYYGSTLFIQVSNVTSQDYAIIIDGKNVGNNRAIYTITEESGNITISTIPEANNTLNITIKKQEGMSYYVAKYFVLAKSLPALTGSIPIDTLLYAIFIIPVGSAVALKVVLIAVRFVLTGGE